MSFWKENNKKSGREDTMEALCAKSDKCTPVDVEVPTQRGISITILGAVTTKGVISISMREFKGSKKRKTASLSNDASIHKDDLLKE
ncbi:uncharacterized protein BX663DRAFT_557309 [Cokeromyces recurvatus]|uniref:uncharacterized protein n=1 Tax=Cokeromyces recurvatus TaxID=90255 RepID=UPI00221EC020|nr:uncharacterized protein BX663DRAFT_557309 [Cokeromyces recurvatus]KAI7908145.1 hypothetical protein BX663DRAFT_557309 [Cokeromyces recurvatus]